MKQTTQNHHKDHRRVLITGGIKRIGLHIAYAFSERGAVLGLNYHHSSDKVAEKAQEECLKRGAKQVFLLKSDITKEAVTTIGHFVKLAGGIDILVNNAGVLPPVTPLHDLTLKQFQATLDLNLIAPFVLSKAAAEVMPDGGKIINLASLGGYEIWESRIDYHVSKSALITLTRAIARELGPRHITVNAIAPGAIAADEEQAGVIKTPPKNIPMGAYGVPDDIANAVIFLAYDATYITGQTIIVDGGRSVWR